MKTLKALIELRYIRDHHPEVVNQKVINEAIAELEAIQHYDYYEYFEVIGNIYENPELLHVKE